MTTLSDRRSPGFLGTCNNDSHGLKFLLSWMVSVTKIDPSNGEGHPECPSSCLLNVRKGHDTLNSRMEVGNRVVDESHGYRTTV